MLPGKAGKLALVLVHTAPERVSAEACSYGLFAQSVSHGRDTILRSESFTVEDLPVPHSGGSHTFK